jgi:hypothetical protein
MLNFTSAKVKNKSYFMKQSWKIYDREQEKEAVQLVAKT